MLLAFSNSGGRRLRLQKNAGAEEVEDEEEEARGQGGVGGLPLGSLKKRKTSNKLMNH